MLFVIDDSIVDKLMSSPSNETIRALNNVAMARRMGIHLIYAEPSVFEYLKDCELLELDSRKIFSKLFSKYPEIKVYKDKLKRCIELVADDNIMHPELADGKKIIRVSINIFENYGLLTEFILLSENLDDCSIYKLIGNIYLYWFGLTKLQVRCFDMLGGGNTTADQYKSIQRSRNRLLLCIVDSDKKCPASTGGDTFLKLRRLHNPDELLCEYLTVDVHEIENIIPISLYREASKHDVNILNGLTFLEKIEEQGDFQCLMCFDYKNGIRISNLVEGRKSKTYIEYWYNIINSFGLIDCNDIKQIGIFNQLDSNEQKKADRVIIKGLGTNVLNTILQKVLTDIEFDEVSEKIPDYLKRQWIDIGELVVAWGCGTDKMVAV